MEYEPEYDIWGEEGVCGTLSVSRQGLYTVFSARCGRSGKVRRAAVTDGERELALGVLVPEGGGTALVRRFSDAALNAAGLKAVRRAYIIGEAEGVFKTEDGAAGEPEGEGPTPQTGEETEPVSGDGDGATEPVEQGAGEQAAASELPGDGAADAREDTCVRDAFALETEGGDALTSEEVGGGPELPMPEAPEPDEERTSPCGGAPCGAGMLPLNVGGEFPMPERLLELELRNGENGPYAVERGGGGILRS